MREKRAKPTYTRPRPRANLSCPLLLAGAFLLAVIFVPGLVHAFGGHNPPPEGKTNAELNRAQAAPVLSNIALNSASVSTPACGLAWRIFADYMADEVHGAALLAPDNVWTAGSGGISHWDGSQWTFSMGAAAQLYDISAYSPNDIWAVGDLSGTSVFSLVEHWDGAQWSIVPSPNPDPYNNILEGVAAVGPDDVWAVGDNTGVLHWDGLAWAQVPSPSHNVFYRDIYALSATDIWAVGNEGALPSTTVALHWDGAAWTRVASPNPSTNENVLMGVSGNAPDDIWAVGYQCCSSPASYTTLIEHWDGSQWSVVPSPNPGTTENRLDGVLAITSQEVWAAGRGYSAGNFNSALIERWDGQSWSVESNTLSNVGELYSVEALSSSDVWALGSRVVRYYDPCITPSPSPTATLTPTATATGTPASLLIGHVTWQGPPSQPNSRQQLPVTLTLRSGNAMVDYPTQDTDAGGFLTVSLGSLPSGTYQWDVKGPRYLANCGSVNLAGAPTTQVDMGLMKAGDANNSNLINTADFTVLKNGFGGTSDLRADFNNDGVVNTNDFTLFRGNFGQVGCSP